MKIGEVARLTDTPASTIRYYEKIGLLPEPKRASGQRVYRSNVLEELEIIGNAQDLGFTLEEIKIFLNSFLSEDEPSEKCQELARRKTAELEDTIEKARKMKQILDHGMKCKCKSLNGCYVASGE